MARNASGAEEIKRGTVPGTGYLAASLLGGIAGSISVIIAQIADLKWECAYRARGCFDGQGGIVLVVLVPVMFVVGCLVGLLWTWLTSRTPSNSVYASVFAYNGPQKRKNRLIATALSVGLWCLICSGLFGLMIYLDQF
jgi:hypothetical protein